ncbi:MAG: acetylxylan esterase [Bryobacteraceae bacterium]
MNHGDLRTSAIAGIFVLGISVAAQRPDVNYDESKVGSYMLPDPLTTRAGQHVRDTAMWNDQRRPEILEAFAENVFGHTPQKHIKATYELHPTDNHALGGKAIRKQVTVHFSNKKDGPKIDLLVYVPMDAHKPVPAFLGLNFEGNHTVSSDPGIQLPDVWVKKVKQPASDTSRGSSASEWQVEKILDKGYALATAYYGDIEPDFNGGIGFGVRPLFFERHQTEPAPDDWGAIGAWAWGLSRAMDYLETDSDIDAKHVALMGHSRLGKTALWAGAQDPRFALVISNDSGEGGAALSRRNFGETIQDLNTAFPHWFCGNYRKYNGHADQLPVDHHMLLALIAPRPLYVASAEEDRWADPRGEFLSAVAAGPVYELFGKQGLGTDQMPAVGHPIMHTVGYHIRPGKHDVTAYDWEQYLTFAEKHFR